jgi:hypothetical protein
MQLFSWTLLEGDGSACDWFLDRNEKSIKTVVALMHTCRRELSPAHLVCPRRHNV